jgi:hypothetical protein
MVPSIDFEFNYTDRLRREATHRVRIFSLLPWTTLLITDMTERYACASVTNSIEDLVNALLVEHPEIRRGRMVVIEHYDYRPRQSASSGVRPILKERESFDLVSFHARTDGLLYEPDWKRITKTRAEEWIGCQLP